MKETLLIILSAASASAAIELNKLLLSSGVETGLSVTASSATAAVVFAISLFILTEIPLRIRLGRKLLDSRAKYEGVYFERLKNLESRPVSISKISYNSERKSYSYRGKAFDEKGVEVAKWYASDIQFISGEGVAKYFFEATIFQEDIKSVRGYGVLDFRISSGHFVDSGSGLEELHHTISRLDNDYISRLLGSIVSLEESSWPEIALALNAGSNDGI